MTDSIHVSLEKLAHYLELGTAALYTGDKRLHPLVSLGKIVTYIGNVGSTSLADASVTVKGKVELATNAETATGTDTVRAVTPAGLAYTVPDASATAKGKVELATDAEATAFSDEARAVTPHGLGAALGRVDVVAFAGVAAAGPVTVTGLKVGDVVRGVICTTEANAGEASASFEQVVTVADQLQQSEAANLSARKYFALIQRMS